MSLITTCNLQTMATDVKSANSNWLGGHCGTLLVFLGAIGEFLCPLLLIFKKIVYASIAPTDNKIQRNYSTVLLSKKASIPNIKLQYYLMKIKLLRCPVDSILDAVFTVSPNKQYLGIVSPTMPEMADQLINVIWYFGIGSSWRLGCVIKRIYCLLWSFQFPHWRSE